MTTITTKIELASALVYLDFLHGCDLVRAEFSAEPSDWIAHLVSHWLVWSDLYILYKYCTCGQSQIHRPIKSMLQGGMKAVIWADVAQTITMFLGVILSIVFGMRHDRRDSSKDSLARTSRISGCGRDRTGLRTRSGWSSNSIDDVSDRRR